jgi:hypothetical protein
VCLLEQSGVLDGDTCGRSQRGDNVDILGGEVAAASLLGEVEVAEHRTAHPHRHPEEGSHRGVVRRKTVGPGMGGQVV